MSIEGVCIPSGGDYVKASSYINKRGERLKTPAVMGWNNLVFKKEELNNCNWLYVGNDSEEGKKDKLISLEWHKGFMWIMEE